MILTFPHRLGNEYTCECLWITHSETAPKGLYIEAQCAALGYLGQRRTTFQALKGRNILNRWLMTGA